MKKLTLGLLLFLATRVYATAPSMTVVTATLQDSSTQVWSNATWTTTFLPSFGNPGVPNNNGNPVSSNQSGVANSSGLFTVTLDDNMVVAPAGSKWKFTICPNASVASCNELQIIITGATMNLSAQLNAILTVPVVNSAPVIARGYNDTEVNGSYGTLYINSIDNTLRECQIIFCQGTGWVTITVPINNPVFTGTLTTGCVKFKVDAGNDVLMCPQAGSGHIAINLPTVGGVVASNATSPIVLNSTTGNISCPTCGAASFPLFAPDSLATAPQYSFANDHGTGMRRDNATARLGWSVAGTETMSMNNITVDMVSLHVQGTINTDLNGNISGGGNLTITGGPITVDANPFEQTNGGGTPIYSLQGFEVANPGPANPGKQKGYFKAGSGWCTEDSASAVYCTVNTATSDKGVQSATTQTTTGAAINASDSTWVTKAVTMPSSGCPCRAYVSYSIMFNSTGSGTLTAWVKDSSSADLYATAQALTNSAGGTGPGISASAFSPHTFTNGASVTFTGHGWTNAAGSVTVTSPNFGSTQDPWINIVIFTSN